MNGAAPTGHRPPRLAVVGCGYWGKNLVRNFHALGALAAVADGTEAGRATAAQLAPGIEVVDDLAPLLGRPELDAVVIATPAATHAPLGLRVLAAGKDLLVEKPMALTLAEGRALVAAAAAGGRILQVGHLLEYHPAFLTLRDWLATGRLGRLLRVHSHRLGFGQVRTEEDALWSLAPHDLSLVLRLTGKLPEAVSCHGSNSLGTPRADTAVTILHFAGGPDAHLLSSWLHPVKEQKLVVTGDRGMAVFDDAVPEHKLAFFDQHVAWTDGRPHLHRGAAQPAELAPAEPLRLQCAAFLEAVASRRPPLADGVSGLRVIAVLEACRRSLELGGQHVAVEAP